MWNDETQKFHGLSVNTGIDTQYIDRDASVENRSVFTLGRRSGTSIYTSNSPVPKVPRVNIIIFVEAKKKSGVYFYFYYLLKRY